MTGYMKSNTRASELWERVYPIDGPGFVHIALTDTFSSKAFFDDIFFSEDGRRGQVPQRWKGLRQDSGDPIAFARQAKEAYDRVGVDVSEKVIVFSDSLDVEKSLEINKVAKELGFKGESSSFSSLTHVDAVRDSELWNRDVLDERLQNQGHR
jgi:nicotinate phosphoribosyltransferase